MSEPNLDAAVKVAAMEAEARVRQQYEEQLRVLRREQEAEAAKLKAATEAAERDRQAATAKAEEAARAQQAATEQLAAEKLRAAKAEAQQLVARLVGKARLPDATRARLAAAFKDRVVTEAEVTQAVKDARDYLDAVARESGVPAVFGAGVEPPPAAAEGADQRACDEAGAALAERFAEKMGLAPADLGLRPARG